MKSIVSYDEYNEADIKPKAETRRYIELVEQDLRELLASGRPLHATDCPACKTAGAASAFQRFGLGYAECPCCGTLYVAARPDDEALREFYRTSTARRFWRDELTKASREKRREKILTPRFEWIEDSVREHLPQANHVAVIGADGPVLRERLGELKGFERHTLLDPYCPMDASAGRGVDVLEREAEPELAGSVDAVALFETADRAADVDGLFARTRELLAPGGLCFITAILASGFDISALWEHAENVIPPDRLNLFTVRGLTTLFERHGFRCLEFSTPGVLDVEITAQALAKNPAIAAPRVLRRLVLERNHMERLAFQEFLQANLLSSYGRALIQKI